MSQTQLSSGQVAHFLEHGYVKIESAFPRNAALRCTQRAFDSLGYDIQDPSTWKLPTARVAPSYFTDIRIAAPSIWSAVCQLLGGVERIARVDDKSWSDFVILNLSNEFGKPWTAPGDYTSGWHKDGQQFRHFLDSPEQGLLGVTLWSDIAPRGGGTYIAPQSVGVVARYLLDRPEGVHPNAFPWDDLMRQCPDRLEITGQAGDAFLLHPFMLHTMSPNPDRKIRAIANPLWVLTEPMQLNRQNYSDYSVIERAILRGLNKSSVDFSPTRARICTPDSSPLPE